MRNTEAALNVCTAAWYAVLQSATHFAARTSLVAGTIAITTLLICGVRPAMSEDGFTPQQKKAIEDVVRGVIREHPEIVLDALEELQRRQTAAQEEQRQQILRSRRDELVDDPNSFAAGNPDASVTVVEFFDYRCGFCKRALPTILELLESESDVRVVYKEFPILGPDSIIASRAAIASISQGKYFEFHNALMETKGTFTEERVLEIAEDTGLDAGRLKRDMKADRINEIIEENRKLAVDLGISGTPSFVIGDQIVPGVRSLDQMRALIAEARTGCVTC